MFFSDYIYGEDKLGMIVTSGTVKLLKDSQNRVGICIDGGAPYCPCLYVAQILDNTPAATDGSIQAGDELVSVNGISIKGKTKVEAARMIQSFPECVSINFNKLHADPKQGKTLDIILKKVKHRIVETMDSDAADALGLSRAILVNDGLVKKFEHLNKMSRVYAQTMSYARNLLRASFQLARVYAGLGQVFNQIGVQDPGSMTSQAFSQFGATHRSMEEFTINMLTTAKPILSDMATFLRKAVPDTKLTIKKYLDVKFEYLSYCLKVKEMDDEAYAFNAIREPLYRVETGNYEYRLILRCRQNARQRFASMRDDVLVKLELLDNKHVQDTVHHLKRLIDTIATYHDQCHSVMKQAKIFPLEVDLACDAFTYPTGLFNTGELEDDDDQIEYGQEADVDESLRTNHSTAVDDVPLIDLSIDDGDQGLPYDSQSTNNQSLGSFDLFSSS